MKDDSGYPQKLDPRSEPYRTIALRDLQRIIRDEIEKLLTRLLYSAAFFRFYRDYAGELNYGELNYKALEQELLKGVEEERAKEERGDESSLPFVFRVISKIFPEIGSPELHQVNSQQENGDVLCQFYRLDYSPPTEWKDLFFDLGYLYIAWGLHSRDPRLHEDLSPFSDILLLLAFAKLMGASYELLANYTREGKREIARTKKSTRTKREKAVQRRAFVIGIYEHGEHIASGTRRSEAIRMIQRQFMESKKSKIKESKKEKPKWGVIPDDMKTPGPDSIIELFKAEGILERDFEEKAGHWFKKM